MERVNAMKQNQEQHLGLEGIHSHRHLYDRYKGE